VHPGWRGPHRLRTYGATLRTDGERRARRASGHLAVGVPQAESSDDDVVLEGIHALKHALRFGAHVRCAVTADPDRPLRLAAEVATDVAPQITQLLEVVSAEEFAGLSRRPPASPVLALATRAQRSPGGVPGGVAVVLFEPRHPGNAGAVIRVAAAAGASSVLITGALDPWSPAAVRSAAGLQYALDVARIGWPADGSRPLDLDRPLIAFDPDEGVDVGVADLPPDAALVFGGERHGLPPEVLAAADRTVRIPMRAGVSSLNLATSVAVALYSRRPRAVGDRGDGGGDRSQASLSASRSKPPLIIWP